MGHVLGAKKSNFLIRGAEADEDSSANVAVGRYGGVYRRSADNPRVQGLPCTITSPGTSRRRTARELHVSSGQLLVPHSLGQLELTRSLRTTASHRGYTRILGCKKRSL